MLMIVNLGISLHETMLFMHISGLVLYFLQQRQTFVTKTDVIHSSVFPTVVFILYFGQFLEFYLDSGFLSLSIH